MKDSRSGWHDAIYLGMVTRLFKAYLAHVLSRTEWVQFCVLKSRSPRVTDACFFPRKRFPEANKDSCQLIG